MKYFILLIAAAGIGIGVYYAIENRFPWESSASGEPEVQCFNCLNTKCKSAFNNWTQDPQNIDKWVAYVKCTCTNCKGECVDKYSGSVTSIDCRTAESITNPTNAPTPPPSSVTNAPIVGTGAPTTQPADIENACGNCEFTHCANEVMAWFSDPFNPDRFNEYVRCSCANCPSLCVDTYPNSLTSQDCSDAQQNVRVSRNVMQNKQRRKVEYMRKR